VRAHTASEAKEKAYGHVTKSRPKRASRAGKSAWSVETKIAEANAIRSQVAPDMRPLFDHLLNLARHSAQIGRMQEAGREIAKARGFAKKYPHVSGDRSRKNRVSRRGRR
jgi:hypothetical protein